MKRKFDVEPPVLINSYPLRPRFFYRYGIVIVSLWYRYGIVMVFRIP